MSVWQRDHRKKWLEDQNDRLIVVILGMAMILLAYLVHVPKAHAQEASPHGNIGTAHSHDGARGQMYRGWMRPDLRLDNDYTGGKNERYAGCCNNEDCRIVRTRMVSGKWQFLSQHKDFFGQWREVPDAILESNYEDAELTPDGNAHACERKSDGLLLCFTPGDPEL